MENYQTQLHKFVLQMGQFTFRTLRQTDIKYLKIPLEQHFRVKRSRDKKEKKKKLSETGVRHKHTILECKLSTVYVANISSFATFRPVQNT